MSDKIARYYNAAKNPDEQWYADIPLRDLTEDEYEALGDSARMTVDATDSWWTKTKPRTRTDEQTEQPAASRDGEE